MARKKRRGEYGKGTVFERTDRGTYSISWRHDGKRLYEHGFADAPAAQKRLAVILGDAAAGKRHAAKGKLTLNDHAAKWLADRAYTHRAAYYDVRRWENHLRDTLGRLRPNDVTTDVLKNTLTKKKKEGLGGASLKRVVALLSSLYSDLIESGAAQANPCRALAKKTRAALLQSSHDEKNTPFLELADVERVYRALLAKCPTVAVAYAIGAYAGLRTSEVRALAWDHIDLERGTMHVQVQVEDPRGRDGSTLSGSGVSQLKDGESRIVAIQPALASVLKPWREIHGGEGLVCKPLRGSRRFLSNRTMTGYLGDVVRALGLEAVCSCCQSPAGWYEYTRHSMASNWVITGGSMETLKDIMGHSSVLVTERYRHLRPGHFSIADRNRLQGDLGQDLGQLATELATERDWPPPRKRVKAA